MANIKISQLPNLSQLANTTQFPVANANVTYAVTSSNIQSYMSTYPGGTFTGAVFSATGNVIAAGNVQAGNVRTTGLISATGNITSGNVSTGRAVITTANITTGNITAIVSPLANITNATIDNFLSANAGITGGNITGITDLTVADGGTGRSSLTSNNLLVGAGASAVNFIAPGSADQVLVSDGTNWSAGSAASIGYNQTWQNLGGSRGVGVTYTNSSGRPIQVLVTLVNTSGAWFYINGNLVIRQFYDVNTGAGQTGYSFVTAIIPDGNTYLVTSGNLSTWWELR
jgi:hypothetical protein